MNEHETLFDARYHVPRSQVWEGSRGRQSGCVHLHVTAGLDHGRKKHQEPGDALCGKARGWYERPAEGERLCPKCEAIRDAINESVLARCPNCGGYVEDLDGFGVLAHEACGYCTHFDVYNDICRVCGSKA